MDYIRRLDADEIDAYIAAIDANEHRKQLLYVPMGEKLFNQVKAKMYNSLLIENPIFAEHEEMIAASREQYLKAREKHLEKKRLSNGG